MSINITKGRLKQLIKEEVDRMTSDEDVVKGSKMADQVIGQLNELSDKQKHAFLTKFISFLTENNT